jgi:hypothetical protein
MAVVLIVEDELQVLVLAESKRFERRSRSSSAVIRTSRTSPHEANSAAVVVTGNDRPRREKDAANVLPVIREIQASGVKSLRGVARALAARGISPFGLHS